jgi:hypothetical protein
MAGDGDRDLSEQRDLLLRQGRRGDAGAKGNEDEE